MPDQQDLYLGQSIGKYRLVSRLGGGGFGTVYLAEDRYEHTQAAVKVLHFPLTKDADLKSFLNEARATRLRHPHIVSLLDFGISQGGLPFLTMEYAPKGTLRDLHPKGEKISLPTIVSYTDQISSALQYAHNHRIIHRDIKPDNILVRADRTLIVSDFGIAKLLEQSVLSSRQKLAGTPSYMAPEQHRGHPCFASDQYALAVMVYEWICGVRPFQGTAFGLMLQHMHTPPPSLRDRLPELSEEVEYVIFKALAKNPQDRFARIQEFADALRDATRSPLSRETLSPTITTPMTAPPYPPKQAPRPTSGPKTPETLVIAPTQAQAAHPKSAIQITEAPVSRQRPAPTSSVIGKRYGSSGQTSTWLAPRYAALFSYLGICFTGLIFFFWERKNRLVRFSAAQSIVLFLPLLIVYSIFYGTVQLIIGTLGSIPLIGFVITGLLWVILFAVTVIIVVPVFIIWLLLMVQAYRGIEVKLPLVGEDAEMLLRLFSPKQKRAGY